MAEFEWDEAKSSMNRRNRGFGFDFAVRIFAGPTVEDVDTRFPYCEERITAIGSADGLLLAVIYTDRGDVRRIISARRADRKERERWHSGE